MKTKLLVLLIVFSLLAGTCTSVAEASASSTVKVAVYYEAEHIDSSERNKIVDAIGVVESRFEDQIGYEVDLEIVGSWTSIKSTTNAILLIKDAIRKTDGVYATAYDNYKYAYTWKFSKSGYVGAIYIVEQDLTSPYGEPLNGAVADMARAGIVDYNSHGCDHPFDRLCGVIQHELSHIFGLNFYGEEEECNEPWCVMNYDYMPYVETIYWWIIPIGRNETWATEWCQNCKQKLLNTYEGTTFTYTRYSGYGGNVGLNFFKETQLLFEYYHWNLTEVVALKIRFQGWVILPRYSLFSHRSSVQVPKPFGFYWHS